MLGLVDKICFTNHFVLSIVNFCKFDHWKWGPRVYANGTLMLKITTNSGRALFRIVTYGCDMLFIENNLLCL